MNATQIETPQQAARRFSAPMLNKGYKPVALHHYVDAIGDAIFWRIRLKHPETGEKWIRPMKLNGKGYELSEPHFEGGKPIYSLNLLANKPEAAVWIVEGEQKADALNKLGLVATTSGGASSASGANWQPLCGRTCIIWADNDDPGQAYADDVTKILHGLQCTVSSIYVGKLGLAQGDDVMQWLAVHPEATASDIAALPAYNPSASQKASPAIDSGGQQGSASSQCHTENASGVAQISFRRMSEVQATPIHWLWPGRIARGKVTLIAGDPGLGKSQITASIAAIVSRGGLWPVNRDICKRGNVVFLSAEDDAADTIRPRLEAVGADLDQTYVIDAVTDGFNAQGDAVQRSFNLSADIDRLAALLEKIGNVALVVIDPISAYLGGTDSHKNSDVRALLTPLSELAAKHSTAIVCVSHLNKSTGGQALMRVTGSLAFVAAARAAFVVTKDQENESRRLFLPLKNNIAKDKTGLAFSIQSSQIKSSAGVIETSQVLWESEVVAVTADEAMASLSDPEERGAMEAKKFLTGLLADGQVPSKQIRADSEDAGYSWRTIQRAQKALGIEAVKVSMKDGWVWKIPPKIANNIEERHTNNVEAFDDLGILRGDSGVVEVEI